MALRSIDQRYWTDPYVESLNKTEKLLYIYLFSSVHTSLVGVIEATPRTMAYETASTEAEIRDALRRFERDGKIVADGGLVWVVNHIRHQCTSSPKMITAMRGHLARLSSDVIRKAIMARYPHIMAPARPLAAAVQYRMDTVSIPSRYRDLDKEKISAGAAPLEGAPAKPEKRAEPLAVPEDLMKALRHDFPTVDLETEIRRARTWCALRGQAVRNVWRFLRTWFSNAAKRQEKPLSKAERKEGAKPTPTPLFAPTPEELENNARLGLAVMAMWRERLTPVYGG